MTAPPDRDPGGGAPAPAPFAPSAAVPRRSSRSQAILGLPEKLLGVTKKSSGQLGPLLAWSVVFADIGTSIYYVPGLLYTEFGKVNPSPAAAFVLLTGFAFVLLALKYVNVAARYPDGGGVVSVASDAFGPIVGCLGGILICVDYFLTGAISSVSGFKYLAALVPVFDHWLVPAACGAVVMLGLLNLVGIRESATLTAVLALASLAVNLVVLGVVASDLDAIGWALVRRQFTSVTTLPGTQILIGFGASWLAFSGLESISQIAPALREPREGTALRAMLLVIAGIMLTSPLMTAFETALLRAAEADPDRFLHELGAAYGTRPLRIAIVLTASALLVGAANTAIIGCYHVFLALVRLGYLPQWLAERNQLFGTPHRAIAVAVLVPVAVIAGSRAQMGILGDMYSFGLLGAFVLTSLGLDRIRTQERARGPGYWLGLLTSLLVLIGWTVNLVHKHLATVFGGSVTAIGFGIAYAVRRGWIAGARSGFVTAEAAEKAAADLDSAKEVLTMDDALDSRRFYPSSTLVAVRGVNIRLFQEALARARGAGDRAVYVICVDEVPGLFFPPKTGPSREAASVLRDAVRYFEQAGFHALPIWRMAHDAGASVAGAAKRLHAVCVMVGTSQRNAVWHLLRGNVLKSLMRELPARTRVWICN